MDIAKLIQLLAVLLQSMPDLLTFPGLLAKIAQSWGMTEVELRARLAEQEAGLPEIIKFWESYHAQRNPGDVEL